MNCTRRDEPTRQRYYITTAIDYPNGNNFYSSEELVEGRCPEHPTIEPEWVEEENYFFALSTYSDRLLAYINTHADFIVPVSRRAEVLGFIHQGLRDFPVSRQVRPGMARWGVPVPGDEKQVIYVWFDALTNYLTAVGFPHDAAPFDHYWPADTHVIGKDITRFHCLYWPAMLLSAGLPLPRQVAVHGFLTLEGERISKSSGNVIDPVELVDTFGVDAVRYYLLRNLSFASDENFSRAAFIRHYNDELANELGNLLNRVVTMINRYRGGAIPAAGPAGELSEREEDMQRVAAETRARSEAALERWDIGGSLGAIWSFVRHTNQYIERCKPWVLARQPEQQGRLDTVLYTAAEATRLLAIFLAPYIPRASDSMMDHLGVECSDDVSEAQRTWGGCSFTRVKAGPLLFPRIENKE